MQARTWRNRALAVACGVTVAAIVVRCGGGGGGGGGDMQPTDRVSRLEIEGVPQGGIDLGVGASSVVSVEAFNAQGDEVEDAPITASSSNTTVATVAQGVSASRVQLAAVDFTIRGVGAGVASITFRNAPSNTTEDLPVRVAPAPPGPPPPPPPPPAPGDVIVMTGNGNQSFVNGTTVNGNVTVARGRRVIWDWNDPAPHSTTSDTGVWNSGIRTGTNQSFSFTFMNAGTFRYHCMVHGGPGGAGMSGTITVTQ